MMKENERIIRIVPKILYTHYMKNDVAHPPTLSQSKLVSWLIFRQFLSVIYLSSVLPLHFIRRWQEIMESAAVITIRYSHQ